MIPQSVADILAHHVKLAVEGIDRMYLNVYVPRLQTEQRIVWFFRDHRGQLLPSGALMSPISRGFVAALEAFAAQQGVSLVQLHKGQRKDDVMAEHLRAFDKDEGVVQCLLHAHQKKLKLAEARCLPESLSARHKL